MENQTAEIIELNEYQPELTEEVFEDIEEVDSGMSTGLAMLIGGGLTVAGIAAAKFAKKKYLQFKAKKEQAKNDVIEVKAVEKDCDDSDDYVEVDCEEND